MYNIAFFTNFTVYISMQFCEIFYFQQSTALLLRFYCVVLITSKKEKWEGRERKCDRVRKDRVHGERERERRREGGGREKTR